MAKRGVPAANFASRKKPKVPTAVPGSRPRGGHGRPRSASSLLHKPKPKAKATSSVASILRFHDPFQKSWMLPTPGAIGNAVAVPSISRLIMDTNAVTNVYLIIQWTPNATRAISIDAADRIYHQEGTAQGLVDANPTSIRPLAMSVRIRNTARVDLHNGAVRVLSSCNPLTWEFDAGAPTKISAAMLTQLEGMMANSPEVRTFTNTQFSKTHAFTIPPANRNAYAKSYPFIAQTVTAEFNDMLHDSAEDAPMNIMVMQWSTTINNFTQHLDITVSSQDACRFSSNTLYSALSKPVPQANQQQFDKNTHILQQNSTLPMVVDGAAVPVPT